MCKPWRALLPRQPLAAAGLIYPQGMHPNYHSTGVWVATCLTTAMIDDDCGRSTPSSKLQTVLITAGVLQLTPVLKCLVHSDRRKHRVLTWLHPPQHALRLPQKPARRQRHLCRSSQTPPFLIPPSCTCAGRLQQWAPRPVQAAVQRCGSLCTAAPFSARRHTGGH